MKSFENQPRDAERDAPRVQAFFDRAEEAFRAHPAWRGATPAVLAAAGEGLEKYVLTKIHAHVFGATALDAERDEALAQRLSALSFVKPEHLEIPASHAGMEEEAGGGGSGGGTPAAARALALAQRELSKVNAFKAPRDKLVCVLNACRVISDSLSAVASREAAERRGRSEGERGSVGEGGGEGGGAARGAPSPPPQRPASSTSRGADDFLPLLILVLIRASPPRLASNLEFIQRFRGSRRFHGESAYFFTQLYAAASFVETVNTGSLNVDPGEFVARMASAGVPDMQLLPPPRAVVEAAMASDDGGGERRGGATAAAAAASAAAAALLHPQASASAVRENPAFFLAAAAPLGPSLARERRIPSDLPLPRQRREAPLLPLRPSPCFPTAEQLEKEGEKLVVAADESGELAGRYRFLNSAVGGEDLSIADVTELLRSYRATALRCEALARAADARARAWREGAEEEGEGEEREGGGGAATATSAATAAAEETFVPSPPWVPSSSYAAAEDEPNAATAAAAAAPEAELDLSALDLSSSPPPSAVPQPPPLPPSASSPLDVAHLLTSSTNATPRAAEAVVEAVNDSGSGSASLI